MLEPVNLVEYVMLGWCTWQRSYQCCSSSVVSEAVRTQGVGFITGEQWTFII